MNIREALKEYGDMQKAWAEIKNEIDRLTELKRRYENSMAEIEDSLKNEMIGSGKKRAVIAGWKLNLSNSMSTIVEAEDELPEEYWKVFRKPDLTKIKEDIKLGFYVAGARVKQNQNLTLKQI